MRLARVCRAWLFAIALGLVLPACTGDRRASVAPADSTAAPTAAAHARVTFVNRVWAVVQSPTVAIGQLYVFLSDGTLVVTSLHGTPSLGRWSYEHGKLTMTEQGIAYAVEIGELTSDRFRITLRSPGEPVTMTLGPAEGAAIAD